MHSLKTKITMLTVWIVVFAVAAVTLLSVMFIRNAERRKSDQLLLLLCETGERNLDYYFNSVEKSVQKVATFAEKDVDGLEADQLERHTERVRDFFEVIANRTNGVLTFYYRIDPTVSDTVRGFWYTNLDGKEFTEHEVTDITLYDTADTTQLVWFTVPKNTGKAIWLPPYITDNLDVRVISYNMPIFWRGRFVGVIGIELDYTTMAEQVESIRLYNNGYAFLTDRDGNLIYHPRIDLAELPAEEIPEKPEGLFSESTFSRYSFEGVEKEAVWLRITNGMRLYVSVPEKETEGDWAALVRNVLIVSGAVLVLAVLLARFFALRITRPLLLLTEAARRANEDDYDFNLSYHRDDELGMLTKSFSRMADHLRVHISDLNKRVYVDALTSVRNKGAFASHIEAMEEKLKEEAPGSTSFGIGVFDCDNLKFINDKFGHDKGDIYLQTAARLICKVFQHSPVFRIGGDEFAVVLQDDDLQNREVLVETFEKASEELNATKENGWEQVSVAIGVAVFNPQTDHSVIDTVRRADKIMYGNKRQGRQTGQ